MSLLDDARRLTETDPQPVNPLCRCHWCAEFTLTEPHAPDCPWLSMPKIAAALERLEAMQAAVNRCGDILNPPGTVASSNEPVLTGRGP